MPHQESETPLARTSGASRESCGGHSRDFSSLAGCQAQFLIAAHSVRPEIAAMLAAVVFDGGAQ